jgi:ABC-type transport system involved in multi-copper enzyme maturation permease subunit
MASLVHKAPYQRSLMAWWALFKMELLALTRSWVLRGWLIALVLTEFFTLSGVLLQSRTAAPPGSAVLAMNLNGFLLVWSVVIIVLGAGSVSLESDVISDSILSRACTRTQFISAKFFSRALTVLGVFLFSTLIAGICAWRYASNDMTMSTLLTGVAIVGLAVLLLLCTGIALSVIFNNTIMAVCTMLLLWYVASPIISFLGADYLSPTSLVRNLPRILKDPEAPQVVDALATTTGLTVAFSKDLNPQRAEEPGNYVIESTEGQTYTAQTAVYDKQRTSVVLGGLTLPPGAKLKVTVRSVTDAGGNEISPAADMVEATVPNEEVSSHPPPSTTGASPNTTAGPTTAVPDANDKKEPTAAPPKSTAGATSAGSVRRTSNRPAPRVQLCIATSSSLKVVFSTAMDPKDVVVVQNYIVESPLGKTHTPRSATYLPANHTVILSGFSFASDDPVRVTVKNVRDADGTAISPRNNTATYTEVTTWKYLVGLGLPTVIAFIIAVVWFARRDL